jgi:hypothetical protein
MYYRFVKKLEAFLRPVMLLQLFVSMIAFCVIGLQMSMVSIMLITKWMIMVISKYILYNSTSIGVICVHLLQV